MTFAIKRQTPRQTICWFLNKINKNNFEKTFMALETPSTP